MESFCQLFVKHRRALQVQKISFNIEAVVWVVSSAFSVMTLFLYDSLFISQN